MVQRKSKAQKAVSQPLQRRNRQQERAKREDSRNNKLQSIINGMRSKSPTSFKFSGKTLSDFANLKKNFRRVKSPNETRPIIPIEMRSSRVSRKEELNKAFRL